MARFNLPDLGEGLQEAEIICWHVAVGDTVHADQPMVTLETAKAVVEVPAPYSGVITALLGKPGDTVATGSALVDFRLVGDAASGGVVGRMPTEEADTLQHAPQARSAGRAGGGKRQARAVPAARDLARKLGVEIESLAGSGRDGLITVDDVLGASVTHIPVIPPPQRKSGTPSALRPSNSAHDDGELEVLRSLRRAMAQSMANARDNVMECTVCDMADIEHWSAGSDYTVRLLRAIAVGARAEPGLNAWFESTSQGRRLFERIDVGLAVDTADGLIVPVLRDVGSRNAEQLRAELERLKSGARDRTLPPADLRDFTFMLSNFGVMAGRYATPVVVPPAVAILGAGKVSRDVVAVEDRIEAHRRMPLSLTFDHRCVTGGEAVRLLAAVIADLELPQ
ncbi:MAG: dihydrolipoamide acetyltransferase family protein [Steroidobacteraceae bacterium]